MDAHVTVPVRDRVGIAELFAEYAWRLDGGDVSGFVNTFTDDGVLVRGRGPAPNTSTGRHELARFARELCSQPWFLGRQHHVSNVAYVTGRPGEQWMVRSYVPVTECRAGSRLVVFRGFYEDACVFECDGWRLRQRRYGPRDGSATWAETARPSR